MGSSGRKWWCKWMARLDQWVKDDILRTQRKRAFERVWGLWEDQEVLAARAVEALAMFCPLLETAERRCEQESKERWIKFKEGVAKGEAAGFRIIKEKLQERWACEQDVSNVAHLRQKAVKWKDLWAGEADPWNIRAQRLGFDSTAVPVTLTAKEIGRAAKTFKKRTTVVKGWRPHDFGWLSDEMPEALDILWHMCEVHTVWPSQEEEPLAKLIPKASGGLRLMMRCRSTHRVYSRARRATVLGWLAGWSAIRPEVNMAPGMHTTGAIWRSVGRSPGSCGHGHT